MGSPWPPVVGDILIYEDCVTRTQEVARLVMMRDSIFHTSENQGISRTADQRVSCSGDSSSRLMVVCEVISAVTPGPDVIHGNRCRGSWVPLIVRSPG